MKQEQLQQIATRMRAIAERLPAIAMELETLRIEAEALERESAKMTEQLICAYPNAPWVALLQEALVS